MAWPFTPLTTYNSAGTPAIKAFDLNAFQSAINKLSFASFLFGTGADGTAILDGTNTVAWASKSGSVYTLTRDVFADTLTLTTGASLFISGFKVFARSKISVAAGCKIHCNGLNGSGTAAAVGTATGSLLNKKTGETRSTSGSPTGGTAAAISNTLCSAGGNGGSGDSTGSTLPGGAGGTPTAPTPAAGGVYTLDAMLSAAVRGVSAGAFAQIGLRGGLGGGGGHYGNDGISSTANGGGGGSGGGVVVIATPQLVLNGTIESKGGTGANAAFVSGTGATAGGGGGGSGGDVALTYVERSGSGSVIVTGGAGGTGTAGGVTNGSTGGSGFVRELQTLP